MFDIIIKNATIYDGSGEEPYISDVGIIEDKIKKIAKVIADDAKKIIDAKGKFLTPGFIDSHSHNDVTVSRFNTNFQKLEQGVTTEVVGTCGVTFFPINLETYNADDYKSSGYSLPEHIDPKQFTTTKSWIKHLETLNIGTNMVTLVGHGSIRMAVMGFQARKATKEELKQMQDYVEEAMQSGATGLSSGIAYAPGVFSDNDEIIELCKIVKKYDGIYSTHMRNQGTDLIKSIEDNIHISKVTGCTTVISHLKSIGRPNWGKIQIASEMINKAQEEGINIYCDIYPYLAGSTTIKVTLPPSILEGGDNKICERLSQKKYRDYTKNQILNPTEKWENAIGTNGFNSIFIITANATKQAEGMTIEEYAKKTNKDPFDTYFDLIVENKAYIKTINFVMSEEDFLNGVKNQYCMIGSDGATVPENKNKTHPRLVGTFPKFLGEYVREKQIFSWQEAIKKCTSLPAKVYMLENKGLIKEDFDADIVIFDPNTIKANSDFVNCYAKNTGLDYVILAGKIVVKDNEFTGLCNGKAITLNP